MDNNNAASKPPVDGELESLMNNEPESPITNESEFLINDESQFSESSEPKSLMDREHESLINSEQESPINSEPESPIDIDVPQEDITKLTLGSQGVSRPDKLALTLKKKRGRPRKYDVTTHIGSVPTSTLQGFSSSFSDTSSKRGRGRPKGSGKLQLLAALGGIPVEMTGANFTPHVITVPTGKDLMATIKSFAFNGTPRAICVLTATGALSIAVISKPNGVVRFEGNFEILSLNGLFVTSSTGCKTGNLSIMLSESNGQVFGGGIAGELIAANHIQLILGSFNQNISKKLKRKHSAECSTAAGVFGNPETLKLPMPIKAHDEEQDPTPIIAPVDDLHPENQNLETSNPLENAEQNSLQLIQPVSDQAMSPNANAGNSKA